MLARVILRFDVAKLAQKGVARPLVTNFSTEKVPKEPKEPKVKDEDKKVISRKIFVSAVAKKTNMTQEEVKSVLNSSISFIKEVVMADKEVRFANFGTFKLKKISARRRRNPSTGDYFEASAKTKLQFKSSPKWDKSDEEDAEN